MPRPDASSSPSSCSTESSLRTRPANNVQRVAVNEEGVIRRAPRYLEPQYAEPSVSIRTTPAEFGAWTKLSWPMAIPTCEAPSPRFLVLKKIRSPGLMSDGRIVSPTSVLLLDDPRHGESVLCEDVLHQAAAIEPAGVGPAQAVGHTAKPQRELRNGTPVESGGKEIGCDGCVGCVGATGASGAMGALDADTHPCTRRTCRTGKGLVPHRKSRRRLRTAPRRPSLLVRSASVCIIGEIAPEVQPCQ